MIRNALRSVLAIAFVAGVASSANAASILDQQNLWNQASLNGGTSSLTWQQEVIAGLTGQLTSFEVFRAPDSAGAAAAQSEVFLNLGGPWQADANIFSTSLTLALGWNSFDVSSLNIFVSPGTQFVIGVHGLGGAYNPSIGASFNSAYAGALFLNASGTNYTEWDMAFRTYVDTGGQAAVPEPSTWLLLGTGLAAVAARRRFTTRA